MYDFNKKRTFKVVIILDDEKIEMKGYDKEKIVTVIDDSFTSRNIQKIEESGKLVYQKKENGSNKDAPAMWCVIGHLAEAEWFESIISDWYYYEGNYQDTLMDMFDKMRNIGKKSISV